MSFDWSEYLTLAQELTSASISSPIQEAHLRAAVSRAYYAAFCKARNYLHNKDGYLTPRRTNAHSDVIMKFERSGDMERRKVGTLLRSLRGIRRCHHESCVGMCCRNWDWIDPRDMQHGRHPLMFASHVAEKETQGIPCCGG